MNYSIIGYIVGMILNVEAILMLLPCVTAIIYGEREGFCFLIVIAAALLIGIPTTFRKPKKKAFYARESYVAVAFSWLAMSVVGAVPFVLTGSIPNFTPIPRPW